MYVNGFTKNVLKRQIPNIFRCRILQTRVFSQLFRVLQSFKRHIASLGIQIFNTRILVAVSGGVDSMTLLDLLISSGFDVGIAHVNFGLRGKESDLEEKFVQQYAMDNGLDFYCEAAETLELSKEEGLSIQMAARKLRYDFFERIANNFHYNFIATAHHADDNFENLFIYLIRNNIQAGFRGISPLSGNIVRPLLQFTRNEIVDYANANKLQWCEDSSNKKDNYLRNKIRHHIVPGIKEFYPEVMKDFMELSNDYREYLNKNHTQFECIIQKYLRVLNTGQVLLNNEIATETNFEQILKYFFRKYGFGNQEAIKLIYSKRNGTIHSSDKAKVLITRAGWLISLAEFESDFEAILIEKNALPLDIILGYYRINLSNQQSELDWSDENSWYFDGDNIKYPIEIRPKRNGDRMTLFGMHGSKKISDLLIDAKIEVVDKSKLPLICDTTGILGILPLRRSAKYPINKQTKNILKITWNPIQSETP
jgi:tRNA(Ile)-lysidine synthase